MRQCDDVKVTAADRLGINRNTLHKKLEQYAAANGQVEVEVAGRGGERRRVSGPILRHHRAAYAAPLAEWTTPSAS